MSDANLPERIWVSKDWSQTPPTNYTRHWFPSAMREGDVEYVLASTAATTEDAVKYLESINAPVTEDRILWAKFLATKPTVEQVNLASSLVLEDRTRHGEGLAEALRGLRDGIAGRTTRYEAERDKCESGGYAWQRIEAMRVTASNILFQFDAALAKHEGKQQP